MAYKTFKFKFLRKNVTISAENKPADSLLRRLEHELSIKHISDAFKKDIIAMGKSSPISANIAHIGNLSEIRGVSRELNSKKCKSWVFSPFMIFITTSVDLTFERAHVTHGKITCKIE